MCSNNVGVRIGQAAKGTEIANASRVEVLGHYQLAWGRASHQGGGWRGQTNSVAKHSKAACVRIASTHTESEIVLTHRHE